MKVERTVARAGKCAGKCAGMLEVPEVLDLRAGMDALPTRAGAVSMRAAGGATRSEALTGRSAMEVQLERMRAVGLEISQEDAASAGAEGAGKGMTAAKERVMVENFIKYFNGVMAKSDFLSGDNKYGRCFGIDWLLRPENMAKVLEGTYERHTQAMVQAVVGSEHTASAKETEYIVRKSLERERMLEEQRASTAKPHAPPATPTAKS